MTGLPQTWVNVPFMDVFDIQGGTQPPKSTFKYQPSVGYVRLLQIRDFGSKPVPTYVHHTGTLKYCQDDDVLIGRYGASVGRICTGMSGAYNVALAKVLIPEEIEKKFVFHLLRSESFQEPILGIERSAQDGFNKNDLSKIVIPLAPLNEQRRIVAKLENLLSRVNAAQQRLATIPHILKRFRQSVLAAACSGRLTVDWRSDNTTSQTASELIASLKTPTPEPDIDAFKKSSESELPTTWAWAPLGKLGPMFGGGTPLKNKEDFWHGNIPWVSPKDMKRDRISDSEDRITEAAVANSSVRKIVPGSVLFVVRGMILNHTLPVAITDSCVTLNQDMKAVTPELEGMSEYLFLASKHVAKSILFDVKEATHGTRRIETRTLKNWAIPIPPLPEQQEIVRRVEALFKTADALEARYLKAKAHVDKLTQSILAKAFRGELVPQDPTDEPAAVLLERIREQRNGPAKKKRPAR